MSLSDIMQRSGSFYVPPGGSVPSPGAAAMQPQPASQPSFQPAPPQFSSQPSFRQRGSSAAFGYQQQAMPPQQYMQAPPQQQFMAPQQGGFMQQAPPPQQPMQACLPPSLAINFQ